MLDVPKTPPRATIYDVADRAGVSVATVSRVINDARNVSDRTRRSVNKAIEELHFRPDRVARTLAKAHRRPLAVAVPTFTTPFHVELLKGIRSAILEVDHDLLVYDLQWKNTESSLLRFLNRGSVGGLVLAGITLNPGLGRELTAQETPAITVGGCCPTIDSFYWDERDGARQAVAHLIEQGHRHIGMLRAHTEWDIQSGRLGGYRQALEEAGLPFIPHRVACGRTEKHAGFSEEAGYEAMQQLMATDPSVTAVFASSDAQAIGAWKALRDAGRRVPHDVALAGYGDIKTSHYVGLTSIDLDVQAVARDATRMLLAQAGEQASRPPVLRRMPCHLHVRGSSVRELQGASTLL